MLPTDSTRLTRRGLLGAGALLAAAEWDQTHAGAAGTASIGPFQIDDQQPFRAQTRRLKITRGNRPVAALVFSTDYPTHFRLKPELMHVCTPSGVPVTGTHEYCFIHHQSIMCGHGRVQCDDDPRIIDFYRQLPFADEGRTDRWHAADKNLYQLGPSGIQRVVDVRTTANADTAVIGLELAWQTREVATEQGETMVNEHRVYRITQVGRFTVVDLASRLVPANRPVTLWPENHHGYLGVRVHDLIDVEDGGRMHDSLGRQNPSDQYREASGPRQAPLWVDCTGQIGAATVGMALIGHPQNLRNEWYVREFGLMIVSAAQSREVRITADHPFEFAARFVAHDGELDRSQGDRLQAQFSGIEFEQLLTLPG